MVQDSRRSRVKRARVQESSGSEFEAESEMEVDDQDDPGELVSSQLSSLSSGSAKKIDAEVFALIEKKISKKKEEKQKKMLSTIEKHLDQENSKTAEQINEIFQNTNELHSKFLLDYAACEDRIRKKWVKIHKETEIFEKFIRDRQKAEEEGYKTCLDEKVAALSKIRATHKSFENIVKELTSKCSDVSDMRGQHGHLF